MLKEGYIANWKKYPKNEIKIRVARPHLLSPSEGLLWLYKEGLFDWERYEDEFIKQMANPECLVELYNINELSCYVDVRLMCYEKDPNRCHRGILIDLIHTLPI